jgi:hypothetical protein
MKMMMMNCQSMLVFLSILFLLLQPSNVHAQINGLCVCQPRQFTFTLDFTRFTCVNSNDRTGLGGTSCSIGTIPGSGTPQPIQIDAWNITEIDRNGNTLRNDYVVPAPFFQGNERNYTTWAARNPTLVQNGTLPAAIRFDLRGINAEGSNVIFSYRVELTNDCTPTAYPVLPVGYFFWIDPCGTFHFSICYFGKRKRGGGCCVSMFCSYVYFGVPWAFCSFI